MLKLNIDKDLPHKNFDSYTEFLKYFQEMIALFRDDTVGKLPLSQFVPNCIEIEYIDGLERLRVLFPRYTQIIIVQIPKGKSRTTEEKKYDLQICASLVKIVETDLGIKFAVIKKLFDEKVKGGTGTDTKGENGKGGKDGQN